ncbi:MAG: type II toxin-antitoxin system VapC family toxin [Gammaproteobacteria bacterium]
MDTSALMAILLPEADGPSFYARLTAARSPAISSVGKVELLIVLTSRQPATAQALFSRLRQCTALSVVSVDETIADLAIAAFARYGKGRHPAGLNFGDCFSYALAQRLEVPLLFKGNDFSQTDIQSAGASLHTSAQPVPSTGDS